MTILSDGTIWRMLQTGRLKINPLDPQQIQPGSVDVRLGNSFLVLRNYTAEIIDPSAPPVDLTERIDIAEDGAFILHPGEFVLATTIERFELPDDVVGKLEGKSSRGRIGLMIHATAGFIDPGFCGDLTLEMSNIANLPIRLQPGMRIGQVAFMQLDQPCVRHYGHPNLQSHYQGQVGVTAARHE